MPFLGYQEWRHVERALSLGVNLVGYHPRVVFFERLRPIAHQFGDLVRFAPGTQLKAPESPA